MALAAIFGVAIIAAILLDAFETVVLPRRVTRHLRLSAWFYRYTWRPWARLARHIKSASRREAALGYFGPLSEIVLLGLWAIGLIFGFGLLQYGIGEHVRLGGDRVTFWTVLYMSGETFFTLGLGDVAPVTAASRFFLVMEGGMGFAFLGVVIGYLPIVYSSFSRREIEISLLDARAGSPPTAAELLARFATCPQQDVLDGIFRGWEQWAAQVLESHLSYPVLSFFRSQHNNQSWLGALTAILDATALVIAGIDNLHNEQAKLTFAMARHAVVDLAQVLNTQYDPEAPDRLPDEELARLRRLLTDSGVRLKDGEQFTENLSELRAMYEPYAEALASRLFIALPHWFETEKKRDNWQAGPWDRMIQARSLAGLGRARRSAEDHF